ncbi:HEPN domain-containing protein [Brevundimonas denitrificans]|uniref:HEPN domain-containing protein n=1 Tax=Brevundimonas denitrificans TaxID=1443434 RepID=UPI00352F9A99
MMAASRFITHARLDIENQWNSLAAFHLHQAAENFYNAVLLAATLYTPKSHNLVRLRTRPNRLMRG